MRLVIFNELPTSIIFGEKIDAWWFNDNGFDVEFWDLSPIFWTDEKLNDYFGGNSDYKYYGPNHKSYFSLKSVFVDIDLCEEGTLFYDISGSIYGFANDGSVLKYLNQKNMKIAFKRFHSDLSPVSFTKNLSVYLKVLKRKLDNKYVEPDVYFCVGLKSVKFINSIFPNVQAISIPSPQVNWNSSKRLLESNYILFVDESIEYEPDAKMTKMVSCKNICKYYERINKMFDNIERWTGFEIIIAASGKYIYSTNPFGDRKIVYKKTFQLMDYAKIIIGHTSSALEHNIKSKKPMLFIDDKDFTNYKRSGFKSLVTLKGNKVYFSDRVKKNHIEKLFESNNEQFESLVSGYFKQSDISNDYKKIIANYFLENFDI